MPPPPSHKPVEPEDREFGAPESEDRDRALRPLADEIRTGFIMAYRRHHLARTGLPSDFGARRLEPRWDGGTDRRGRRHRAIWYDVARLALAERIEPFELIEAAFAAAGEGCLPKPGSLLAPDVVARATAYRGVIVENLLHALRAQCDHWKLQIYLYRGERNCDFATAARATLRNRRLDLSALFRHCMAVGGDDPETAALFEAGAVEQYVPDRRAYDRAWGEEIPATLKEHADRIFRGG